MLKFWLAFPNYATSKGRQFTWAQNISRNLAIDRLREQRRISQHTQPLPGSDAAHLAAPLAFQPEHIGVRDWLPLLPPGDRRLVELLFLNGYTQAEVADKLRLPLGTVKLRSRRIIRVLAQRVSQPIFAWRPCPAEPGNKNGVLTRVPGAPEKRANKGAANAFIFRILSGRRLLRSRLLAAPNRHRAAGLLTPPGWPYLCISCKEPSSFC